ncbi:aspartate/glutamate racemase family protein [Halomonas qaidamensis]|uniref:Aspartate/glutamate racemase family protein n=1 Tax=Halomonas qaidamensis TaxID=2866211 RepID=A0ABY6JNK3_9GAMM|nr:aspartate/glutamate racemase family protein [Halomonas qaidamensis]UYV18708.1 aspartate/glutamate racemase family protein [Halomonas qaidamensis]
MRLLVINPNSSTSVTQHIAAAARMAANANDEILAIEASGAPPLIVSEADSRLAEQAVVNTVRSIESPLDGVIVASFGDTGADALRAFLPCPVVGIGHASLLTAAALGGPFAIVSFAPAVVPSMQAMVEHYQMQHLLSGIHVIDTPLPDDPGEIQATTADALQALCQQVAQQGNCRSIILAGGPLAGLALRIAPALPLPIIDATMAAVQLQRSLQLFGGRADK